MTNIDQNKIILTRAERNPLIVPESVKIEQTNNSFKFSSSNGSLSINIHHDVECIVADGKISFRLKNQKSKAQVGTARANIANIITGLTKGFEKKLELKGVGYKAKLDGSNKIVLSLGKSHPDIFEIPAGVEVKLPSQTDIVLTSIDNVLLGQAAANIRAFRPPEPYKGKGVRYADEQISLKEVKKQ